MKQAELSLLVVFFASIACVAFMLKPAHAQVLESKPSFVIRTNDSEISTATNAIIILNLDISPAPTEKIFFTYNETNTSEGTIIHAADELGAPNIDFKTFFAPQTPGKWDLSVTAHWGPGPYYNTTSIKSNTLHIQVKPAIWKSRSSYTIGSESGKNYTLRNLFDWSLDGEKILVTFRKPYSSGEGSDSIGFMNPSNGTINEIKLPSSFQFILDARIMPNNNNVILIYGLLGNNPGVFKYNIDTNQLISMPKVDGAVAWVHNQNGIADKIAFLKQVGNNETTGTKPKAFEIWTVDSNGSSAKMISQVPVSSDVQSVWLEDSNREGTKLLVGFSEIFPAPISLMKYAEFDFQTKKLEMISQYVQSDYARFAPFDGLIIYDTALGDMTPGGPLRIETTDGSFTEVQYAGEHANTADSPTSFVVSPDGRYIVSIIGAWGSGSHYITKTELAQSVPEFSSTLLLTVMGTASICAILALTRFKDDRCSMHAGSDKI